MTDNGLHLADRTVLLAGASGGIGRELARELHERGADLVLVGRNQHALDAVDVPGWRLAADLRDPAVCEDAVRWAVERSGRLDVVINAVGVVAFGGVAELSVDAVEELFLTNTFVPIFLARAALPKLEAGGAIVNISGVVAERGLPGMAAYSASKAAVRSFDEGFGREARRRKLRVIDARPPHTSTTLSEHPIEGVAPKLGEGLPPATVARVIVDGIEGGATDLPASAFA